MTGREFANITGLVPLSGPNAPLHPIDTLIRIAEFAPDDGEDSLWAHLSSIVFDMRGDHQFAQQAQTQAKYNVPADADAVSWIRAQITRDAIRFIPEWRKRIIDTLRQQVYGG